MHVPATDHTKKWGKDANCLNVFIINELTEPLKFASAMTGAMNYCAKYGEQGAVITFTLREALTRGAKVYKDMQAAASSAFILSLPPLCQVPCRVHPLLSSKF